MFHLEFLYCSIPNIQKVNDLIVIIIYKRPKSRRDNFYTKKDRNIFYE